MKKLWFYILYRYYYWIRKRKHMKMFNIIKKNIIRRFEREKKEAALNANIAKWKKK